MCLFVCCVYKHIYLELARVFNRTITSIVQNAKTKWLKCRHWYCVSQMYEWTRILNERFENGVCEPSWMAFYVYRCCISFRYQLPIQMQNFFHLDWQKRAFSRTAFRMIQTVDYTMKSDRLLLKPNKRRQTHKFHTHRICRDVSTQTLWKIYAKNRCHLNVFFCIVLMHRKISVCMFVSARKMISIRIRKWFCLRSSEK